ncbi:MAG TPA: cyclopropane-fatty-acyl-phospholipid synthase family protein [Chitinophagales bacterium]|nr:cyclopropane-fatty-acyl-phospholipid synthase family protein [Chitinophagales bacterium]HNA57527.1 cyclopropane-fatty-acyl-phospholipid synthase family protein [Chitinophagales bacterium]HNE46741.1 cyclopropane-fatty-acyl-phospholipid synthase family protein [Chitinophagales bacterium]HNF69301.1 cyclopropane-fatty-acyl-phospholipid synthase family protein [Chitinophagales bacterium]HNI54493.1 cyclopropane-fatty-acyl-phospholipid synthase family protein [Chitinophagales bacterium]
MINTLLERDRIPDFLIRARIRSLLRRRLKDESFSTAEQQQLHLMELIGQLKASPIAIETGAANEQHYEVPTAFFSMVMGKHMKYSCCYWDDNTPDLSSAEAKALEITCQRAQLREGMNILELGCGWGSLTMFMAQKFPSAHVTGVSNSSTQKLHIESQCKMRGITNVRIITADMNVFDINETFDRVVSVEMFEHMRNYQLLLEKISRFLKPDGKLFVHIFTHKEFTYFFDVVDDTDWMSKYFFTGGVMPSDDLLFYFNDHLTIQDHWHWDGTHYGKTSEAWLSNMDAHKNEIMPILAETYGAEQSVKWWVYWRIFFMACAELWNFNNGREWIVSHYLFTKKATV